MNSKITYSKQTGRGDMFTVFVCVLGIAVAFLSIYKYAHTTQPGNAVWAAVSLLAFSQLLSLKLAKLRSK